MTRSTHLTPVMEVSAMTFQLLLLLLHLRPLLRPHQSSQGHQMDKAYCLLRHQASAQPLDHLLSTPNANPLYKLSSRNDSVKYWASNLRESRDKEIPTLSARLMRTALTTLAVVAFSKALCFILGAQFAL